MPHQRDLALSARSFLRPVTSRRIPLNPDLGYWGGVLWAFHAGITNGAGTVGNQIYTLTCEEGSEMEVLYGRTFNGDTTNRTATVDIDDNSNPVVNSAVLAGNVLGSLMDIGQSPAEGASFPAGVSSSGTARTVPIESGARIMVGGGMRVFARMGNVAVNQDSTFAIVCRIRGVPPEILLMGPAGFTSVINTNEFF